ncbi:MAG TPA: TetR family transcriptional regulator C-terminal domain-containing protein [Steroidobacteraceae bacterium]|jgi:AcrR family transcriptional regulator|nr:TetR family transcriptional regulator C-terminal domain-containing protein [Steroidobacteraceae bacterium]
MPKIVDHEKRRDEIALVACRVVAEGGFDQATIVRIAREAGYTTGMVAHYFDTKQDIIIAALRLMLRRIDERLLRNSEAERPDLLALLTEMLPVDEERYIECAFWIAFWGQVTADKRLKRINTWVHREYQRLYERCLSRAWPEWPRWPAETRDSVRRSVSTLINGLTAGAVASRSDWPAEKQVEQMRLQVTLLREWAAKIPAAAPAKPRKERSSAA